MNMQKKCFLHIGAPKTGTTFLQKVLTENGTLLRDRGILYPDAYLRGYGHHDIAFLLSGGYPDWAIPQPRSLAELAAALKEQAGNHSGSVLLSSENFYLYPNPEKLFKFLDDTGLLENRRPIIVVYLRRQDDAHESWYNQTIKAQGYTHTPEECIDAFHGLWDYAVRLDRWAQIFGSENLVVRPYEASSFINGDLLADFFRVIGIDGTGLAIETEKVNTRLNRDALEFQRLVNGLPLTHVERRKFHRQLMELSARTSGSGVFEECEVFDRPTRKSILASYAESNARVSGIYLAGAPLFGERDEDVRGNASIYRGLSSDSLARILAWLMIKGDVSQSKEI